MLEENHFLSKLTFVDPRSGLLVLYVHELCHKDRLAKSGATIIVRESLADSGRLIASGAGSLVEVASGRGQRR